MAHLGKDHDSNLPTTTWLKFSPQRTPGARWQILPTAPDALKHDQTLNRLLYTRCQYNPRTLRHYVRSSYRISFFFVFSSDPPRTWLLHLICCRWGTRGFGGVKYACEALTHVRVPCAEMCDEIRFVQKRVVARETVLRTGGPATLCVQTRDVQKNKVLLCSERQSHLPFKILHALLIYFKSFWSGTGKDYWKS